MAQKKERTIAAVALLAAGVVNVAAQTDTSSGSPSANGVTSALTGIGSFLSDLGAAAKKGIEGGIQDAAIGRGAPIVAQSLDGKAVCYQGARSPTVVPGSKVSVLTLAVTCEQAAAGRAPNLWRPVAADATTGPGAATGEQANAGGAQPRIAGCLSTPRTNFEHQVMLAAGKDNQTICRNRQGQIIGTLNHKTGALEEAPERLLKHEPVHLGAAGPGGGPHPEVWAKVDALVEQSKAMAAEQAADDARRRAAGRAVKP